MLTACGGTAATGTVRAGADTVSVDRQRCSVPGRTVDDSAAVRCATLYVIRNGYTNLPPVPDSAQWVGEFMELGMAARRGRLNRHPVAVCGKMASDSTLYVLFLRRNGQNGMPIMDERGHVHALPPSARAVMVGGSGEMRMMHQDAALPEPGDTRWCRMLGPSRESSDARSPGP